jgi:hypothetical protein
MKWTSLFLDLSSTVPQSFPFTQSPFLRSQYSQSAHQTTYNFSFGTFSGTSIPQSKSRLIAARGSNRRRSRFYRYVNLVSSHFYVLQESILSRNLHNDQRQNQCFVDFMIGVSPVVDFGLIKSVAFSVEPHFSHWSPYASSLPHFGASSHYERSAKNWSAFASHKLLGYLFYKIPCSYSFLKIRSRIMMNFSRSSQ